MNSTVRSENIVRRFAAICCFVISLSIAQADELKEAHVTQVVKDVKLLPEQASPRPATVNDPVRDGTAVRTGVQSRSELTFTDRTITRLGANTIFSFKEGTRTMDLGEGAILVPSAERRGRCNDQDGGGDGGHHRNHRHWRISPRQRE